MSVFTSVTSEDVVPLLEAYDLGSLVDLQGIPTGIDNTNYFLITTRGRFVLTVFEQLTRGQLPVYLGLMAHLADRSVPCPRPLPRRGDGYLESLKGKPAAVVTRLPGRTLEHPRPEHCAQVGEVLARMHLAGADYPGAMPNLRGPRWWAEAARELELLLLPEDRGLLADELRHQRQARLAELPQGVVHADLFRDNVLFDGERIGGIIDFYFACRDALLYDVAITVNDWCIAPDGELDLARAGALLKAYHARRPFGPAEHLAWPVMLRAGALRFWVSRLYDFYLPRPGELTHAKDPEHFKRILLRHREAAAGKGCGLPRTSGDSAQTS